jgi:hypothetical protein
MFNFQAKFLTKKPTTTAIKPNEAAKSAATTSLYSRLFQQRQHRAMNEPQLCARCGCWR